MQMRLCLKLQPNIKCILKYHKSATLPLPFCHSDQMSEGSQVSKVTICVKISKVALVPEGYLLVPEGYLSVPEGYLSVPEGYLYKG